MWAVDFDRDFWLPAASARAARRRSRFAYAGQDGELWLPATGAALKMPALARNLGTPDPANGRGAGRAAEGREVEAVEQGV
jgi:hypothetical protein